MPTRRYERPGWTRCRALALAPALLLEGGCAATARGGPGFRLVDEAPVVEGQGTLGAGIGLARDRLQLVFPLTLGVGHDFRADGALTTLEGGTEMTTSSASGWGFRAGPRFGGTLAGPSGNYLAMRAGPTFNLAPPEADEWSQTLSLEAMAAIGTAGELKDAGIFGLSLTFGWDLYGSFRIPSGRPLRDPKGDCWRAGATVGEPGSCRRRAPLLSAELREVAGSSWLAESLAEYASIASFRRFALELLQLGAPAQLVLRAARAARQELGHTLSCLRIAEWLLGRSVHLDALPAAPPRRGLSLAELAVECWVDGCVGEAAASRFASWRAARARDPEIRTALATIAREERHHAELARDVLQWCTDHDGDALGAVHEARDRFAAGAAGLPQQHASLEAFGLAPAALYHAFADRERRRAVTGLHGA